MSSETTTNDTPLPNTASTEVPRPPMTRSISLPAKAASPIANNPWYRQKFEFYRDVIEEKVHEQYPGLPSTQKLEPANIELSQVKGYDLDFPVDLKDGRSAIVSVAYGHGGRPPYLKEERRSLVYVRQDTTDSNE